MSIVTYIMFSFPGKELNDTAMLYRSVSDSEVYFI